MPVTKLLKLYDPAHPLERCGLITARGRVIEIDNVHTSPELGYRMDPKQVLEHLDKTVATWHTHPDSDPNLSQEDYAGFSQWPALKHYIVGMREGKPTVDAFEIKKGVILKCA